MRLPAPDDMGDAPVWENYVIAQAAHASLSLIPPNALALGVEVHGLDVTLRCQLRVLSQQDEADLDDIVGELEVLLGSQANVTRSQEIRDVPQVTPTDGIGWIFIARD